MLGFRTVQEMTGRVGSAEGARQTRRTGRRRRIDFSPDPVPAGGRSGASASAAPSTQDHGLEKALDHELIRALRAPALEERKKPVQPRAADPQHQPHRVHDAVARDHQALRRRGPAALHDAASTSPDRPARASRRSWRKGISLSIDGRRQRLFLQGHVGRPGRDRSRRRTQVHRRGQHHHRQRRALRRDRRRGVHPRPRAASASACATAARRPSSRASATTAAST